MDWDKTLSMGRMRSSTRPEDRDKRNEFESDYGRIVFSPALRRMHDKTQVFPLATDDNIHTRLTHSLEVQSVCSSIGMNLCYVDKFSKKFNMTKDEIIRVIPVILSSISLCHDIGNPPFGHFGEKAICSFFEEYFANNETTLNDKEKDDFLRFDGNAQGFRVLTRLQPLQDHYGLNLTFGTLSSFLKYPNLSTEINKYEKDYKNKIGVYQSERDIILKIRQETELNRVRHPLVFIMEAADTICYLVMDIEDGYNKGYYNLDSILEYMEKNGNDSVKESITKFKKFLEERLVKNEKNRRRTEIVNFRIFYIQELVILAIKVFIDKIDEIDKGKFNSELIFMDKNGIANVLLNFTKQYIFNKREIQSLELTGDGVLKGLLGHFVKNFINYRKKDCKCSATAEKLNSIVSNSVRSAIYFETGKSDLFDIDDYYKLRMIVDYVSGMTDQFALKIFQQLQGIRIA